MKIAVIFTGGTIGSKTSGREGTLDVADAYRLLENAPADVDFDTREPLNLLSENMTVGRWNTLRRAFEQTASGNYDGVVITHGTDTLAFTASLFAELYGGMGLPTVFVSAGRSLDDPDTNGIKNFNDALVFLKRGIAGVYASYGYDPHTTCIYRGDNITQSRHYTDRFESRGGELAGRVEDGVFLPCGGIRPMGHFGATPPKGELEPCVHIVEPFTGLDYRRINLAAPGLKAVLHTSYHSFTACADAGDEEECALVWFAQECQRKAIPLYMAPARLSDRVYASARAVERAGVVPMEGMTAETAYARLLIRYSLDNGGHPKEGA